MLERHYAAERVLFFPQVADYRDFETAFEREQTRAFYGRLVDDAGFSAQIRRQFLQPHVLQHHHAGGQPHGFLGIPVSADVPVQVGPGEGENQRLAGTISHKLPNRSSASAGVQGQHEVRRLAVPLHLHLHPVTQPAQHRRPAQGGVAVATAGTGRCRSDDGDSHARP